MRQKKFIDGRRGKTDIFKLCGKIVVDSSEARKQLKTTQDDAEKTETRMSKAFDKIGQAFGKAFRGRKSDVSDTKESLQILTKKVELQRTTLDKLKDKYKDLRKETGKESDEAKTCADNIKKLSSELKSNEKKLSQAQKAADQLNREQKNLDDSAGKAKKSVKELGDSAKNTEGGFSVMKGAIANVLASGFEKLIDLAAKAGQALWDFGKDSVESAAEVSAENSALTRSWAIMPVLHRKRCRRWQMPPAWYPPANREHDLSHCKVQGSGIWHRRRHRPCGRRLDSSIRRSSVLGCVSGRVHGASEQFHQRIL